MWLDGIGFAQPLEDPTKSRIVGKVGYGVMPTGPKAQHLGDLRRRPRRLAHLGKKKGAAWFYVQCVPTRRTSSRMLQDGAGAPVRNSAFANPDVVREFKFGKQWVDCMLASAQDRAAGPAGHHSRHRVPRRLRRRAHQHDQRRRSGRRAEEGDARFQPVLDKSEKG